MLARRIAANSLFLLVTSLTAGSHGLPISYLVTTVAIPDIIRHHPTPSDTVGFAMRLSQSIHNGIMKPTFGIPVATASALATEVQEWQHHRRPIMIHIKRQYDAYNRAFKLVDRGLGSLLEDYALYDL